MLEGADDVVLLDELQQGVNPAIEGQSGCERFVLNGVTMSVPRTLANRRRLTTVDGLSSAKSRTSSSTSMSDLSTREPGRLVRIESSENQAGSVELAP